MLKLVGLAIVAVGFALRFNTPGRVKRLELRPDCAVIRAQAAFAAARSLFSVRVMAAWVYP